MIICNRAKLEQISIFKLKPEKVVRLIFAKIKNPPIGYSNNWSWNWLCQCLAFLAYFLIESKMNKSYQSTKMLQGSLLTESDPRRLYVVHPVFVGKCVDTSANSIPEASGFFPGREKDSKPVSWCLGTFLACSQWYRSTKLLN